MLASTIGSIRKIVKYLPENIFKIVFNAYVIPSYDYCCDIWAIQSDFTSLQVPINRLLMAAHCPTYFRKIRRIFKKGSKEKRKQIYENWKSVDLNSLYNKMNLLTITERAKWSRIKNVFAFLHSDIPRICNFHTPSDRITRSMPRLVIPTCQSEARKKLVKYKSAHAWNELPKSWNLEETSLPSFKKQVYNHIISKRDSIYFS